MAKIFVFQYAHDTQTSFIKKVKWFSLFLYEKLPLDDCSVAD